MTKYVVFEDPGHAWMKVTMKELKRLGIVDKITSYSYRKGDYAFLEEDVDLSTFVDAKNARGETVEFDIYNANKRSRIRNYRQYYV